MTDAGIRRALGERHAEQVVHHGFHLGIVHPEPVDPPAVVARQAEVDAGEGRDGAGGAQQMELARTACDPAFRP